MKSPPESLEICFKCGFTVLVVLKAKAMVLTRHLVVGVERLE